MESLLVGADLHLRAHTISLTAIHCCRKLPDRSRLQRRLTQTPYKKRYSRTCSAFFVWIQPRRSFGSAAYIQSPRVLRILISLPGGNARTLFAVSAVARRAWTSLPVTMAR